jgi:hypothetical protein
MKNRVVPRGARTGDHARCVGVQYLRPTARALVNSGQFRRVPRWHGACPLVARGHAIDELRTAVSRAACALPDGAQSLRDLSRAGRQPARRERSGPLCRDGVPRLSAVWLACGRVRAVSLRRLRSRPARPVFVRGPRGLSQLRGPTNGRARRTPARSRLSRRARAAMGSQPALSPAVPTGVESRRVRGVVAVFVRAVLRLLRARARDGGVDDGGGARGRHALFQALGLMGVPFEQAVERASWS